MNIFILSHKMVKEFGKKLLIYVAWSNYKIVCKPIKNALNDRRFGIIKFNTDFYHPRIKKYLP